MNNEENTSRDETYVKLPNCRLDDPSPNSPFDHGIEDLHYSGWTPLLRACRYGETELVAQLISNGADPTQRDELGWNAVPLAAASGTVATLKEILKSVKWNQKDLAPALCVAALNGHFEIGEILLTSRANPNVPIKDSGITPLMLAAGEGQIAMVTLLLEHGADPDMTNALHLTALDASVMRNHSAVQTILGPVTHLRSKISSHIPLPISPPNRALQSPDSVQPDTRFLGVSPFMGYSSMGSPMLHCVQIPSPVYASLCLPPGNYVANSPLQKNKGFMSPASHSPQVSPFNFPRNSNCQMHGFCQNGAGSSQNISGDIDGGLKSITRGNKRLRKWWCQMKRRCKGDQGEKHEFSNEDKSLDVAMEKRLANFLRSIKLVEYHSLFKSQEVDFETFLTLTEEDLEEIGVKNPAHRAKIVEKIEKFSINATNF